MKSHALAARMLLKRGDRFAAAASTAADRARRRQLLLAAATAYRRGCEALERAADVVDRKADELITQ